MEVHFPTDSDGFLSQECPSCEQRFKVVFGEGISESLSFCPHCGYRGSQCWFTKEQIEYCKAAALESVVLPELQRFQRSLRQASRSSFGASINSSLSKSVPPMEVDDELDIIYFPCCNETIKLRRGERHFCTICGQEIDMSVSESKKVFLSHKGVDKSRVIDFKKTLQLLGYDPWIDEDAMPAGTTLERGILKGMKDSCAVVFFVTPSFQAGRATPGARNQIESTP